MILAIDFDHTICDTHNVTPPHKMGPPLSGVLQIMNRLHASGHTIIIHTCRANDGPRAVKVVEDWLAYFKIPYDSIWQGMGKPIADYYVDDKALRWLDEVP